MIGSGTFTELDELISHVKDGDTLALPSGFDSDFSGVSMAAARALVRKEVRRLELVLVPAGSIQADMLIGAGCVATVQAGSVLLYEHGRANRFVEAQRSGAITVKESMCPAIHAGLIAAAKGLPFMPVRGILGSDILRHRAAAGEWATIANPFAHDDPIVAIAAIRPDVSLFHVPLADRHGNAWIGRRRELATLAHASRKTLITFERVYDGDLSQDELMAPGTLSAMYVTALSHQPNGAWPLHMGADYAEDAGHLREYAQASRTQEGFAQYLARHVHGEPGADR